LFIINEEVLAGQRQYLYSELKTRLDATAFSLVLPLNQSQTAYTMPIPAYKLPANCFGNGEFWLKLATQDASNFSFDWDELINAKSYSFSPFEINAEIKQAQKLQQSHYTKQKQRYYNSHYFSDNNALINALADRCFAEFTPNKVMFMALSYVQYTSAFPLTRFMLKSWHELRFYVDDQMYLHLFDANAGWFRSKNTNPNVEEFKSLLQVLFKLLDYQLRYNVFTISNSFVLNKQRDTSNNAVATVNSTKQQRRYRFLE
jgi:hypothetical protein